MKVAFRTFCAMAIVAIATGPTWASVTVQLTVRDSQGIGVDGASVRWGGGTWHDGGSTDGGSLELEMDDVWTKMDVSYHMTTVRVYQSEVVGNSVTLNTVDPQIRLIDAAGNGLSGGTIHAGGNWPLLGTTKADGYLTVPYEMFAPTSSNPNSVNVRMNYSPTSQTSGVVADGNENVFQTGSIDFGSQNVHWAHGSHYYFTGVVQLLPGTYTMDIGGSPFTFTITAGNASAGVLLKLLDSYGQGVEGGTARWADGKWHAIGTTDEHGLLWATIGNPKYSKIAMTYGQGTVEQAKGNNTWTLAPLQILAPAGAKVDQGGGFWDPMDGLVMPAEEVLILQRFADKNYKFRVTGGGNTFGSQTIASINNTWEFTFLPGTVISDGEGPAPVKASIGGKWVQFVEGMQVYQGTYKFVFSDGTSKNVTVTAGGTSSI